MLFTAHPGPGRWVLAASLSSQYFRISLGGNPLYSKAILEAEDCDLKGAKRFQSLTDGTTTGAVCHSGGTNSEARHPGHPYNIQSHEVARRDATTLHPVIGAIMLVDQFERGR